MLTQKLAPTHPPEITRPDTSKVLAGDPVHSTWLLEDRDGLYCGRTIGSARPGDAFRCMYRRTTWTGTCPGGCAQGAVGVTCAR